MLIHIACIAVGADVDIVLIVELENVKQNFCILRLQCSVNSLLLLVLAYLRKLRSYVGFVLALSAYLLFFFEFC